MKAYLHADDFGICQAQVDEMIRLGKAGALQSVSVFANDEDLPEHVTAIRTAVPEIRLSVHLNFVEGKSLLDPAYLPDLTDDNGNFHLSYGKLLLYSFIPGQRRRRILGELTAEAAAQITALNWCLPKGAPLACDTHQHTLAIPLVFRAIMAAIGEAGEQVRELRLPLEPLGPYFRHPGVLKKIPLVNFVKLALIRFFMAFYRKKIKASGLVSPAFAGVLMTGGVSPEDVKQVFPDLVRWAKGKGKDLELLFHPVQIADPRDCPDPENLTFVQFNTAPRRAEEREIVLALGPLMGEQ